MTPPLFLLAELPDADTVVLAGEEGHHAAKVRRMAVGEPIVLGDGLGAVVEGTVAEVRPDGLLVHVAVRRQVPAPTPRLTVAQALPKGERAELAVETMTELGVDEIVPWAASRSVVQWHGERGAKAQAKWARAAREAAKQSRRAWVPPVSAAASTAELVLRAGADGVTALVLHEAADARLRALELPADGEVLVVVGPEGGVSADELRALTAVGAVAVRLGEPVLRTSTAGPAALAALSLLLGRWG